MDLSERETEATTSRAYSTFNRQAFTTGEPTLAVSPLSSVDAWRDRPVISEFWIFVPTSAVFAALYIAARARTPA